MCVCVPSKAEKNEKVEHVRSGHAPVAQKKKLKLVSEFTSREE